jgi:hypothetical protein
MTKTILLFILAALVFSSCNNSDNTTMTSQTITDNQPKQDSISGYAPVNGLKCITKFMVKECRWF